ncbi:Ribonuclease P protein subunit p20, partial [Lamellibrachia satsuma]
GLDKEEYILRKKLPKRLPKRKNDVYVTRRTDFKAQLVRCQTMLDSDCHAIYIHGLGAATNRAVNLALQLKDRSLGTIDVAINTSTVELVDDLEPQVDDLEPQTQIRNNSAIHIKVFRPL